MIWIRCKSKSSCSSTKPNLYRKKNRTCNYLKIWKHWKKIVIISVYCLLIGQNIWKKVWMISYWRPPLNNLMKLDCQNGKHKSGVHPGLSRSVWVHPGLSGSKLFHKIIRKIRLSEWEAQELGPSRSVQVYPSPSGSVRVGVDHRIIGKKDVEKKDTKIKKDARNKKEVNKKRRKRKKDAKENRRERKKTRKKKRR